MTTAAFIVPVVLGALSGAALGVAFFQALALNVRLYVSGGALPGAALLIGRFAGAALAFLAIAHLGGAALIAAAVGFQTARTLLARQPGRGA